jgi:hypothetical protein
MAVSLTKNVERAKVFGIGATGGLVATLAIAVLIFAGETALLFPRGLFYNVLGSVLGASGNVATNIGFSLHLIAGTVIGIVSAAPIVGVKRVYLSMGRIERRLAYGIALGIAVWALFFVPVSYTLVAPVIEHLGDGFLDVAGRLISVEEISAKFPAIITAALGFHIQYGLVYSVITGSFVGKRFGAEQ